MPIMFAWPLAGRVTRRQRFSTARHCVLDRNIKLATGIFVFRPHEFKPDRLSESVVKRSQFQETYARGFKEGTDSMVPASVMDAIHDNQMPQFTLRNIGRMEMDVDLTEPLPLQRVRGLGGEPGQELREVRTARIPKPELAQVWTVDFVRRMRASFRRILIEDPWEVRFGVEAWSTHAGPKHDYVVEGVHPDDAPGSQWGPTLTPVPEEWVPAPLGAPKMELPFTVQDARRMVEESARKGM
ncbi:MAG: hypothetical protein EXR79_07355 [Myxococcales bacterium]|nr:hypothetical protein [Myxococcales bacterium]